MKLINIIITIILYHNYYYYYNDGHGIKSAANLGRGHYQIYLHWVGVDIIKCRLPDH